MLAFFASFTKTYRSLLTAPHPRPTYADMAKMMEMMKGMNGGAGMGDMGDMGGMGGEDGEEDEGNTPSPCSTYTSLLVSDGLPDLEEDAPEAN